MFFSRPAGTTFVSRGDFDAYDFTVGSFTTDGLWHTLDLSGIVPRNTFAVKIELSLLAFEAESATFWKAKGIINDMNMVLCRTIIANKEISFYFVCFCSALQQIEYNIENTTWTKITLSIQGWFTK